MENKKINKADFLKEITDKVAEKAKTLGFTDEDIDLTKKIVDALAAKFEKNVTVDKVTEIVNDVATELGISKTAVKGVVISTIIDSLVAFCGLPVDPAKKEDKPTEEEPVPAAIAESVSFAAKKTITESAKSVEYSTDKIAKDIKRILKEHVEEAIANNEYNKRNKVKAFAAIDEFPNTVKFRLGKTATVEEFASALVPFFKAMGLYDIADYIAFGKEIQKLPEKYEEEAKNPESKDAE